MTWFITSEKAKAKRADIWLEWPLWEEPDSQTEVSSYVQTSLAKVEARFLLGRTLQLNHNFIPYIILKAFHRGTSSHLTWWWPLKEWKTQASWWYQILTLNYFWPHSPTGQVMCVFVQAHLTVGSDDTHRKLSCDCFPTDTFHNQQKESSHPFPD